MSLLGLVLKRRVKPVPAPVVLVATSFPATSRSVANVVVTAPLEEVLLTPAPATATSSGFTVSMPLYSRTRRSTQAAAGLKVAVTLFAPAAMFFA